MRARGGRIGAAWDSLLTRPEQGWSSLLLLMGLLLIVAISVTSSRRLALGDQEPTGSLVVATLAAGLIGYLLARSGLGLARAHVLGASAGAFVLLMIAGAAVAGEAQVLALDVESLRQRMHDLAAWLEVELDLFLGDAQAPPATTTFLVLGALCWATAQFSAFSVFRHGRAGPAVMATGVLLSLNELLPALEPAPGRLPTLALLSLFSTLAMLLLMRLQLGAQSHHWMRRHIADSGDVSRLFLRTGTLFVIAAVAGATSLTAIATAPSQDLGSGALKEPLDDLRAELSRWLALFAVDVTAEPSTTFDDRLKVQDVWQQGEGVAFVAIVEDGLRGNYWWASAFADFDGRYWTRPQTSEEEVAAGELIALPIDASGAGPIEVRASVTPRKSSLAAGTVLGPSEPASVSRGVRVRSLGDREGLSEITFLEDVLQGGSYTVSSAVHDYDASGSALTASRLRAAGTAYPAWVGRYLQVNEGASGRLTEQKADEILELAADRGLDAPYDKARLLQDQLRALDYATSIQGLCRAGENVPECLLRTETGFCQHFASTMVMVLRELEIPARLVNGYLPGTSDGGDRYEVPMQALHAWVEVYFPDVGWVRFDPTPGDQLRRYQQQPTRLPEGDRLASPGPLDSLSLDESAASVVPSEQPSASPSASGALGAGGDDGGGVWSTVSLAGGLAAASLVALAGLLFVRLRRLPGNDGGLAYGRIVSLATRLGFGPQPSQTEYEYAASLSRALPSVSEELYVVAHARVEKAYGRREVEGEQRALLRRAYARIRMALLRLSWRARG